MEFEKPTLLVSEVYRYMGLYGEPEEDMKNEIEECIKTATNVFSPKVFYKLTTVKRRLNFVDFGDFICESEDIKRHLSHSDKAYIFCATLGSGIDMLINRYSNIKPIKALIFHAIGTAGIEQVCDDLCDKLKKECTGIHLTSRFSPGYGDFDISYQKVILNILKPGLCLTNGNLMLPTKSVSGIIGITKSERKNSCKNCENYANCQFKK